MRLHFECLVEREGRYAVQLIALVKSDEFKLFDKVVKIFAEFLKTKYLIPEELDLDTIEKDLRRKFNELLPNYTDQTCDVI